MSVDQSADGSSKQRQRQMLRRHLSARRGGSKAGCGDRSQHLQANLYRFLNQRPSSEMDSSFGDVRDETNKTDKPQRRDVLLRAINSLQRLSSSPAPELVSGSNINGRAPVLHKPLANNGQLTEQAQQLHTDLRYLALACNPAVTQARAGVSSCAGAEVTQRIATARRKVDKLLRQLSGIDSGCCKGPGSELAAPCKDPLFWRFPGGEPESGKPLLRHQCSQQQQQKQTEQRRQRRRQRRQADPVAQQVARSKAALIGDPVFQVSCAGQEHRWGCMTLPTLSGGLNAADRLGRDNMHRRRLIERREAIRAEVGDFASRLEDKWEAIEDARMDRAIDAACRRLRRALRRRPKKRKSQRRVLQAQPSMPTAQCDAAFVPQSNRLPTMMDVAEDGSDCRQSPADDCSMEMEWGV